jgi:hypothetical protein
MEGQPIVISISAQCPIELTASTDKVDEVTTGG